MDNKKNTNSKDTENFFNIISKAIENRIYGSVEFFFEDGNITQITQRIIKKINQQKNTKVNNNSRPKSISQNGKSMSV